MKQEIELCLDLNIWCGNIVSIVKRKKNTPCQILVEIIRMGYCSLGNIQLVISWGMLNRLGKAIKSANIKQNLNLSEYAIDGYINTIVEYAKLGPYMTLGGAGVMALDDTEDSHVLETAIAGKSKVIVTRDFEDFTTKKEDNSREIISNVKIIIEDNHAIYSTGQHSLHIVQPKLMVEWVKNGEIPPIESCLLKQNIENIISYSSNNKQTEEVKHKQESLEKIYKNETVETENSLLIKNQTINIIN